jgi:hypothetical protein
MTRETGFRVSVWAFLALVLLPALANAQRQPDRDAHEVSSYVLTEAALAKYTQATHSLKPLLKNSPQACDEESDNAKSLSEMVTQLEAVPGAKRAVQAAGMSTREYLVFGLSMLQNGIAAWGLDQPGGKLSPGTQLANVKFYRAHEAAIKKLDKEAKPADCGDAGRADDSEE